MFFEKLVQQHLRKTPRPWGTSPGSGNGPHEKAGSESKRKPAELNRISAFSHCGKRLQRTTLNASEISKFVVTFVVTWPLFRLIPCSFTYERGGGGNRVGGSRARWTKPVRVSSRARANQSNRRVARQPRYQAQPTVEEAGAGIEPANSGFADRDLTTWLPRPLRADNIVVAALVSTRERLRRQAPSVNTPAFAAANASQLSAQLFNALTL